MLRTVEQQRYVDARETTLTIAAAVDAIALRTRKAMHANGSPAFTQNGDYAPGWDADRVDREWKTLRKY